MPLSHERKIPGRICFAYRNVWLLAAWLVGGSALASGAIHLDAERKLVTLADGQGQLALRLNYDGRCVLDQVLVRGREVAAESGVASGICLDGHAERTNTTAGG